MEDNEKLGEKHLVTGIVQGSSGMVLFQKEIYCEGQRSLQLVEKLYKQAKEEASLFLEDKSNPYKSMSQIAVWRKNIGGEWYVIEE